MAVARISTAKYETFVKLPSLDGKTVQDVPGIGKVLGKQLIAHRIRTANDLLNKYKKHFKEIAFKVWLRSECKANAWQQEIIWNALDEWSQNIGRKLDGRKKPGRQGGRYTLDSERRRNYTGRQGGNSGRDSAGPSGEAP